MYVILWGRLWGIIRFSGLFWLLLEQFSMVYIGHKNPAPTNYYTQYTAGRILNVENQKLIAAACFIEVGKICRFGDRKFKNRFPLTDTPHYTKKDDHDSRAWRNGAMRHVNNISSFDKLPCGRWWPCGIRRRFKTNGRRFETRFRDVNLLGLICEPYSGENVSEHRVSFTYGLCNLLSDAHDKNFFPLVRIYFHEKTFFILYKNN